MGFLRDDIEFSSPFTVSQNLIKPNLTKTNLHTIYPRN